MQAGALYELLSIEQKSVARDPAFGSEIITWVPFALNIRGNTTEKSGVETINQDQRVMRRRMELTIRWRAGVTTDMRIKVSDGRVFQIIDSIEIPRKRGLVLTCEESSVNPQV